MPSALTFEEGVRTSIYKNLTRGKNFDPSSFGISVTQARRARPPNENFAAKTLVPAIVSKAKERVPKGGVARIGGSSVSSEAAIGALARAALLPNPMIRSIALAKPADWWADLFEVIQRTAICIGVVNSPFDGNGAHPDALAWATRCFSNFEENVKLLFVPESEDVSAFFNDPSASWVMSAFAPNPGETAVDELKEYIRESISLDGADPGASDDLRSLIYAAIAVCTLDAREMRAIPFADAVMYSAGVNALRSSHVEPLPPEKSPCSQFAPSRRLKSRAPSEAEMWAMCAVWNFMENMVNASPKRDVGRGKSAPHGHELTEKVRSKVRSLVASLPPEIDLGLRSWDFGPTTALLIGDFILETLSRSETISGPDSIQTGDLIGICIAVSLIVEGVACCESAVKSKRNVRHCAWKFLASCARDPDFIRFMEHRAVSASVRDPFIVNEQTSNEVFTIRALMERRGDWALFAMGPSGKPPIYYSASVARQSINTAAAVIGTHFGWACGQHRLVGTGETAGDSAHFVCARFLRSRMYEFAEKSDVQTEDVKGVLARQRAVAALATSPDRFSSRSSALFPTL